MKSNINKKLLPSALIPALAAGAFALPPVTRAQWLMGTVCEITAYGPGADEAADAAFAEIARLDRVMSLYKEASELSALNRSGLVPFRCSESLWEALSLALGFARRSGGAFDPTILPAIHLGPSALESVGYKKVRADPGRRAVSFTVPGMALDLGGIGKGIALDRAVQVLKSRGVKSAFINFGGQIYALGSAPGAAGWRVKVPGLDEELHIRDASVSTSGNSERPGHIVSPFTGRPVMDLGSVTVVAPTGAEADAWSTALFVLGRRIPPGFKACAIYSAPALSTPTCNRHLNASKGKKL